ncbi:hypothetical protein [uncultured Prevotella sp.]|uniref:hypothetical protein n=1 Tax=uncultured Prevotella sp. TaxID=159272 RepID=UPI0027E24001|nr:hypothetical protein [uncultured Prevotella sp.]
MKKILTLMAAMSAASGAFAHDFNWDFSSLKAIEDATKVQEELNKLPYGTPDYSKVQADGNVKITKNGLAFVGGSQAANNVSFTVQANDEVIITATGNTTTGKFYVALNGVVTTAEMKERTILKVNVGNATNVAVWSTEDVMISSIEVQSEAYRNVKADIDNTLEIMNRRIEDINGYAAEVPNFYTQVKAQINKQGKEIERISAELLKYAKRNEVSNNGGKAELEALLSRVRSFIGSKGADATDAEKGTIYAAAKAAYDTYSAIVTTNEKKMAADVKTANDVIKGYMAKTDADWDKYTSANRFYNRKDNETTGKGTYTEKWTAANTASKTAALSLFKTYVVDYNKELVAGAKVALENYLETTDLDTYAAKFKEVGQRAKNIYNRYAYEEKKVNNKKNYVAVQELKESIAKMVEFSAANPTLFDQTGLADLAEKTSKLFTELADRTNTYSIQGPKEHFGNKFTEYSTTANEMKLKWGKAAKSALETEYTEVQKKLDACSEAIATKFQNDQKKLKEYELKFAAQQAKITEIKNACNAMGEDAEKAYLLANDYAKNMETLSKVKTELSSLWSGTQTAENEAIIKANNDWLANLLKARDTARAQYNKAVAQLDSYRNGAFFANEYTLNGKEYETLKTNINKSIKTLYDYSVLIEDAYTDAEKKVAECNKEGKPGEIVAEKANLDDFEKAIKKNANLIEVALNATVAEANDVVKTFFEARSSRNNDYNTIAQATDIITNYDTETGYNVHSVAEIKAAYPDFASEVAFADASNEIAIAVSGTNDKEGKLIITTEDIASASAKIKEFYKANPQTLADDVVKADGGVVVTTIKGAIAKAKSTVDKLQSYAGLRKDMFESSVEWSVAQSKAAGAEEAIKAKLIKYLADLNEEMKAAEKKLKEEDKLNADVDKYNKMIADFNARIANAKDPVAFKKYLAIEAAKTEINAKLVDAQGRIDEAKAELAKLTKENAKTYLSGEITKAENALVAVKTDIANSTDLDADKEQILKDIANIDLKVAIAAAKKLDTVVEGDFNEDGKVDDADLDIASKKYDAEEMTQSEYSVFLETYKKSLNK